MSTSKNRLRCVNCGKVLARGSLSSWLFPKKAQCHCKTQTKNKEHTPSQNVVLKLAPDPESAKLVGQTINSRFEVLSLLGSGGMATVYKAKDSKDGSICALKIIAPALGEQEVLWKRLEIEAKAAISLEHPGICSVRELGRTENGTPFLIMDYVDGKSFDDILNSEGSLPESRALEIFIQCAEALAHAHERNVVHRDLKPSNILLCKTADRNEQVKIVDFGIAKITGEDEEDKAKLTQTGELIGSPLYMSPEQCRGDQLTGSSDIYSLACLMFETLSGQTPFSGENPIKIILKHLTANPPQLSGDLSPGIRAVIYKCLEKDPADRYESVPSLLADLLKIKDGKSVVIHKRKKRIAKSTIFVATGVSVLLVLSAGFVAYKFSAKHDDSRPSWDFLDSDWSQADMSGLQAMNSGDYAKAKESFKKALTYSNVSDENKIKTIEKLALISRIKDKRKLEYSYDQEIKQLSKPSPKQAAMPTTDAINALKAALKAVDKEDDFEKRQEKMTGLTKELLDDSNAFIANSNFDACFDLLYFATPILKSQVPKLDSRTLDEYYNVILAKEAELLVIGRDSIVATRNLDPYGSTAARMNEEIQKYCKLSIMGLKGFVSSRHIELNRTYLRLAETCDKLGKPDDAKLLAERVLENLTEPKNAEEVNLRIQAGLELGRSYLGLKQFTAAITEFEKAFSLACGLQDKFEGESIAESAIEGLQAAYNKDGKHEALKLSLHKKLENELPPLIRAAVDMAIADCYFHPVELTDLFRNPREHANSALENDADLKKAEEYLKDALEIRQHLEQSLATEEVLNSLKKLLRVEQEQNLRKPAKNKLAEMESLARQELAILSRASQSASSNRKAFAYLDLAVALEASGKTDEAQYYIETFNSQFAATSGYALQDKAAKLKAAGNAPDLALAKAIFERGASCYGRGDIENARKFAGQAADLVLAFQPGKLDETSRKSAAEILDTYSRLQDAQSAEASRFKKESDNYRYFVQGK